MKSTSRSPPTPSVGDTPIRVVRGNWGEYLDSTGRKFYFNSSSKEATWKPPRKSLGSSGKLNVRVIDFSCFLVVVVIFFFAFFEDFEFVWKPGRGQQR